MVTFINIDQLYTERITTMKLIEKGLKVSSISLASAGLVIMFLGLMGSSDKLALMGATTVGAGIVHTKVYEIYLKRKNGI